MKVEKIVSNYLDSNVYVLTKEDNVIIVDAGGELEKIRTLIGNKKVCGVLLTHGHYDHSLFAATYAIAFGCNVYCTKECQSTLADSTANYSEGHFKIEDFSFFTTIDDFDELRLGQFNIKCIQTKGHSKCSCCYLIEGQLFAGDTLFDNGIGRIDLVGSDKMEMIESLTRLENVDFDMCYCGHGNPSNKMLQNKNISIYKKFLTRI